MLAQLRNNSALTCVVLLVVTLLVLPGATADAATSSLRFSKVYYDSPGSDTGSNTSVNGEWVRIKNYGTVKKYLTGWTVRDKTGHVYKFGTFALVPGASVTLYTGKGTNSASKRYWALNYYVWNNTGDTAYLRSSNGTLIDYCGWTTRGTGYKTC